MQELPRISIREHIDGELPEGERPMSPAKKIGCLQPSGCLTIVGLVLFILMLRLLFHV